MAWIQRPFGPSGNLVVETRISLDGSGNYDGDTNLEWYDALDVDTLRVAVRFNNISGSPAFKVVEGMHVAGSDFNGGAFEVREHTVSLSSGHGYAELPLTARYFKFEISGGGASDYVYVSARSVD